MNWVTGMQVVIEREEIRKCKNHSEIIGTVIVFFTILSNHFSVMEEKS